MGSHIDSWPVPWLVGQAAKVFVRRIAQPESGVPLHTILEFETTARLLAILLDSGRNVINEHHVLLDEQERTEKDFTPDLFERQLVGCLS